MRASSLLVLALALAACDGGKETDTAGLSDGGAADGGAADGGTADGGAADGGSADTGDTAEEAIAGTVRGHVYVRLYTTDEDGARVETTFDEAFGGAFPFGRIFVGAWQEDDAGTRHYVGDTAIASPSTEGDAYEMPVVLDESGEVRVHATLDRGGDGIIGSGDPTGVYPDAILVEQGTEADDVDITILVDADGISGGSSGGSGGGGGSGCADVTVSGPASITVDYTGGDAIVMLAGTDGSGPWDWDWFTPTATADGAEGDYAIATCADWGEVNLVGAWDSNGNGLIDPADHWGAYASEPGVDGNPVTVGTVDLEDHAVEIPLGGDDERGRPGISVVPFVQVTGTISVKDGTFDDLPTGTTVYVAALYYRPSADLSVSVITDASYDHASWDWADLTGRSSVDFSLGVPAETVVYLWAYADEDGDGVVNESGEAVASGGTDDDGTLDSGTTPSDHSLPLDHADG